jgi:ankyrin repeat protein
LYIDLVDCMYRFHKSKIHDPNAGEHGELQSQGKEDSSLSRKDLQVKLALLARLGTSDEFRAQLKENPDLLSAPVEDSFTSLHLAAWTGNIDVTTFLCDKGATLDCHTVVIIHSNNEYK